MKPIRNAWLIMIEVTNACVHRCAHCTRAVPHVRKPYFGSLEYIEKALKSLEGWPRGVGCMGGEPTIHPQFPEICALYTRYLPRKHRGLWTSGGKKYEEHKELIDKTFGIINFNDHYYPSHHQPIMVASEEIIHNESLRKKVINNCWLQRTWSPAITPKGAFFCEVASTYDLLFDGPGGYPLEPGWWKKGVKEMLDQIERYCRFCSMAIPMETHPDTLPFDYISPGNAERLRKAGSPLAINGDIRIMKNEYTKADYLRITNSKDIRKPAHYAKKGTSHFWVRNAILFQQKWDSIPHKIKSILNDLSIRLFSR